MAGVLISRGFDKSRNELVLVAAAAVGTVDGSVVAIEHSRGSVPAATSSPIDAGARLNGTDGI